jgi:hypothetical protein
MGLYCCSPRDVWLFLRILSLITVLPALLRWLSMPQLLRLLTPSAAKPPQRLADPALPAKVARYTDAILRRRIWVYYPNCLRRSLVLYRFLRKSGLRVHICLGIRPAGGATAKSISAGIDGHAWLAYRHRLLLERDEGLPRCYHITYRFPGGED